MNLKISREAFLKKLGICFDLSGYVIGISDIVFRIYISFNVNSGIVKIIQFAKKLFLSK